MPNIEEYEELINQQEKKLKEYQQLLLDELANGPETKLAQLLHSKLCRNNHTDGCSWFYENNNWQGTVHSHYLMKARKITKTFRDNNLAASDDAVFDYINLFFKLINE